MEKAIQIGKYYPYFALYVTSENDFTLYCDAERAIVQEKGDFSELQAFQESASREVCGYLGYDLKNDIEDLASCNPDPFGFPEAIFFEPRVKLRWQGSLLQLYAVSDSVGQKFIDRWRNLPEERQEHVADSVHLRSSTEKASYLKSAAALKAHLQRGDIYEANFCMEFSAKCPGFDPFEGFTRLQKLTRAPYSVFAGLGDYFILSASPERYLKREGSTLISQPIKGTAKRHLDPVLDESSKKDLFSDEKERSENVMIVDLVRNDLSKVADRDSVKVSELFGVYTFQTVHHLISTIEARLRQGMTSWDAIKATFPMGSMTGAPKISAMKLIDEYENFKRGAYSGAFGIMKPDGDFDFNVLIRTLFFNSSSESLGFGVGSAITIGADVEKEYEECLLKAEALMRSLGSQEHEITREVQN